MGLSLPSLLTGPRVLCKRFTRTSSSCSYASFSSPTTTVVVLVPFTSGTPNIRILHLHILTSISSPFFVSPVTSVDKAFPVVCKAVTLSAHADNPLFTSLT
ncbi:hypothetical protein AMECASPLE_022287 [Ameca splendens]|uniref:Uncharacterized protein n=1 Tax=Ameca splendens TaxID=208324 RepID=A0ABV1AA48_9TELE